MQMLNYGMKYISGGLIYNVLPVNSVVNVLTDVLNVGYFSQIFNANNIPCGIAAPKQCIIISFSLLCTNLSHFSSNPYNKTLRYNR